MCRVLVQRLYDQQVKLPETELELMMEIKGLIGNCESPCVGPRDGFHVYIS